MNWADAPATETQLNHLRQLGHQWQHPLTKREASHIITRLETHSDSDLLSRLRNDSEKHEPAAYGLRLAAEAARRNSGSSQGERAGEFEQRLATAVLRRQEFWMDTFREFNQTTSGCSQVLELYRDFGCRFFTPTHGEVQEILDALDSAMAQWDINHPDLFYQTLELNFQHLARRY